MPLLPLPSIFSSSRQSSLVPSLSLSPSFRLPRRSPRPQYPLSCISRVSLWRAGGFSGGAVESELAEGARVSGSLQHKRHAVGTKVVFAEVKAAQAVLDDELRELLQSRLLRGYLRRW